MKYYIIVQNYVSCHSEELRMKPLLLHYFVTNRCNARCSFCSIWKELPKKDASPADVFSNLEEAKRAGCSFVDFTGGEPLLNPNLQAFLKKAKSLGFITSVTTNCILFPSQAAKLRKLIDLLHFSINADSAYLHDSIRGGASFSAVMESIPLALENSLYPDLLYTYTDENIHAFEGVYEIAQKNKLCLILDPVFFTDRRDKVSPATHSQAKMYARRRGVYLNKAHLLLRRKGGNKIIHPLCRAVSSTVVILPDNRLALPCFHHALSKIPLRGNLSDALEIRERKMAKNLQGRYSFCEGCHINCYLDPSYSFVPSSYFFLSIVSKFKYAWYKYCVYHRPIPRRKTKHIKDC
jgi:MoaA/NifB/PqqE/SkfB family radical SAM enzyme